MNAIEGLFTKHKKIAYLATANLLSVFLILLVFLAYKMISPYLNSLLFSFLLSIAFKLSFYYINLDIVNFI